MRALAGFVRFAEAVNDVVGRTVAYFTLATVLICATVVIIRYVFETGFIWLQELYVWTHAAAFMLGAGFTLMVNRHVRVDILYATRSERTRAWLDLLSTIVFLFPWLIVLWYYAWPYVASSWALGEESPQVGGMPALRKEMPMEPRVTRPSRISKRAPWRGHSISQPNSSPSANGPSGPKRSA